MALIDTADGLVMLGLWWAFVHPLRKLYYNMTITLVSALVALVIGGIQATALLAERFGWTSGPFRYAGRWPSISTYWALRSSGCSWSAGGKFPPLSLARVRRDGGANCQAWRGGINAADRAPDPREH